MLPSSYHFHSQLYANYWLPTLPYCYNCYLQSRDCAVIKVERQWYVLKTSSVEPNWRNSCHTLFRDSVSTITFHPNSSGTLAVYVFLATRIFPHGNDVRRYQSTSFIKCKQVYHRETLWYTFCADKEVRNSKRFYKLMRCQTIYFITSKIVKLMIYSVY